MNTINFEDIKLNDEERQPCEIWTRVMGYYRPVSEFNVGKKSEFYSRVCFSESKATCGCGCDALEMAAEQLLVKTMSELLIGGVETFSTVDFPEKLAAVIFMQGCPWRCPFCYNKAIQKIGQPTGFLWSKFIEFLNSRKGRLDAVVFSGGEPLVQDGLAEAMQEVKSLGYQIGLHTGGYRPEHLAKVLPLVDWVGLDIKAPFAAERYQAVTQTNHLDKVRQSLDLLLSSGKDFECRTTCDPRLLSVADIYEIAAMLKAKGVKKYFLQQYRPVEGDTVSTEAMCESFFKDQALLYNLKASFETFDTRR